MQSKSKGEKGQVILNLLHRIRAESPSGVGLVRRSAKTGRWAYIGLDKAKDKIGHALRKASQERIKTYRKLEKQREKQGLMHQSASSSHLQLEPRHTMFMHQSSSMGSLTATTAEESPQSSPPGSSSPSASHGHIFYERDDDAVADDEADRSAQSPSKAQHPQGPYHYPMHYYPYPYSAQPPPHAPHMHYPPPPHGHYPPYPYPPPPYPGSAPPASSGYYYGQSSMPYASPSPPGGHAVPSHGSHHGYGATGVHSQETHDDPTGY